MKINGKDIKMRIDIGAMKQFKEKTGVSFLKLKENEMDEDLLSNMILVFAQRGGSNITMEDVDFATTEELMGLQDEIAKLMGEAKGKNLPAVSRQK